MSTNMGPLCDERGQSVVIGSLFVFTLLILSFSAYQAFSVPNQNAQVEVEHFSDVEDQFSQLRSTIVNSVGTPEVRSASIDLGTRYPTRVIALNPPPAAGQLETTNSGDVSIDAPGAGNVCRTGGGSPTTSSLVYTPNYNEYREPEDITYETRVIARQFDSGFLYDQRLVESSAGNDEITLYLFTGEVSENGLDSYSLEVNGSNQNTKTLNDPTIRIPSRFNASTWNNEILEDRSDVNVSDAPAGRVELDFTGGDYDLTCATVGLDSDPEYTPPGSYDSGGGGGNVSGDVTYGEGGVSAYSNNSDTDTVSVPNGRWEGIDPLDEFILYEGEEVWDSNDEQDLLNYHVTFRETESNATYSIRYRSKNPPDGNISNDGEIKVTIFEHRNGNNNNQDYTLDPEAYDQVINGGNAYEGADLLDVTTYNQPDSYLDNTLSRIKSLASDDTTIITTEIRGRVTVTIREEALITAAQPQPSDGSDLTFVRLHFDSPTNTTGWQLKDDEGDVTELPEETLSGSVYLAVDETAFENQRGFNDGVVYPLNTSLEDGGDRLELVDSEGRVRDEMGYNGERTSKGDWSVNNTVGEGDVAFRERDSEDYLDNDTRNDWNQSSQEDFFADPSRPDVVFVDENDDTTIKRVNSASEVTEFSVGPQVDTMGPQADLTGDGTDEVPYVDGNGRMLYADADGTTEVLAEDTDNLEEDDKWVPKQQAFGVGTRDGDAKASVYYINDSNYLYRVKDGEDPTVVAPDLLNGDADDDNNNVFKPEYSAGLADIDSDPEKDPIVFNQTAMAYVDDSGGSTTVEIVDLGTRPDGNERQVQEGIGKPITYDGQVQVPFVDGGVIVLIDGDGDVTRVHPEQATRSTGNDKAKDAPIASRDWDGDGTLEILYLNDQPTQATGPQQSISVIEIDAALGDEKIRTAYDQKVKDKGVR